MKIEQRRMRSVLKTALELSKVSIGKPLIPSRFKTLKTLSSPTSNARIKIVIKRNEKKEKGSKF